MFLGHIGLQHTPRRHNLLPYAMPQSSLRKGIRSYPSSRPRKKKK